MSISKRIKNLTATAIFSIAAHTEAQSADVSSCEIAKTHGIRSWQAITEFDTQANHNGVDFYNMSRSERSKAFEKRMGFMPPAMKEKLLKNTLKDYAAFNGQKGNDSQKLIAVLTNINQNHKQNVNDVDEFYANCPN